MNTALSATCPECRAPISDDLTACSRCGAPVGAFREPSRTPLILPGNPALSADMYRPQVSGKRILVGTAIGGAALLGVLFLTSDREPDPPAQPSSLTAAVPAADPESLALPPSFVDDPAYRAAAPSGDTGLAPEAVAALDSLPPANEPVPSPAPERTVAALTAPTARGVVGASTPPATSRTASPVLRLVPLVSDSLRAGELIQLRWSVRDRVTSKELPAAIEFTSTNANIATVDRRTGAISGRAPGRVRIIADAGAAGQSSVELVVRTPPSRVAVATQVAEPMQVRTEAARSASVISPPRPAAPAPVSSAPAAAPVRVTPTPTAAPQATAISTVTEREARRVEMPDAGDIQSAVDRLLADLRRGTARTFEIIQFYGDGAEHRLALVAGPNTVSVIGSSVRVAFEMRLNKFDGAGRPVTRIVPVTMNVEKRDAAIMSSAVAIGALRKP
jgi:Bacterial Ig-like domain (group 2)